MSTSLYASDEDGRKVILFDKSSLFPMISTGKYDANSSCFTPLSELHSDFQSVHVYNRFIDSCQMTQACILRRGDLVWAEVLPAIHKAGLLISMSGRSDHPPAVQK